MSTDINGVQLCIVAKADRDDVGIALLIDGGQSAKALALQVLNLGRCKFTHAFFFLVLFDASVRGTGSLSLSRSYRAVRRPYAHTDSGMKTTRMPTHHATACPIVATSGWLSSSPRTALTISETGWCSAKARSQLGILCVGTNALLAKVNGKSQMKPPDCAASTLLTINPIVAEIHEKAKLVSRRIAAAANQ